MMTPSDDQSTGPKHAGGDTPERACEACGHDESAHGAVATRFCRATLARGVARACACGPPEPIGPAGTAMYGRGKYSGR